MKKFYCHRPFPFVTGALLLAMPHFVGADQQGLNPTLNITTGLAGKQARVTWPAQPGVRYRIEKSSTLTPDGSGGWTERALVEATGSSGEWVDPEPESGRAFYRVPEPSPEVFSVYPAVLSPAGGVLMLEAQCLAAGSSLVFEVDGSPPVVLPLTPGEPGTYRAVLPPGAVAPGSSVLRAFVNNGGIVIVLDGAFEVTESGRATDSPPSEPPAWRAAVLKTKTKSNQSNDRWAGGDISYVGPCDASLIGIGEVCDDGDDGGEIQATLLMPALMKAKEKANRTKCSNNLRTAKTSEVKNNIGAIARSALPGEVTVDQEVLSLAAPAGPDICLSLHYRSRADTGGITSSTMINCGGGWTCSYDIRIVPVPLAAGATAPRLYLFGGDGRRDILIRQADGSYRGDGMFREGRFDPDTTFRLTFADKSQLIFCRLVGAPWSGRIGSIADRNGVAINFTYNAASQLETVASQFGQSLTLAYGPDGKLSTVTDHTGRFARCAYYPAGDPGGNTGDLKSVSCPQVTGQAPLAGPSTFTYSSGNADDRLNRNLLTARDGANAKIADFGFSTVTDPASIEFDTCVSADFHRKGELTGHVTLIKFEIAPPVAGSLVAYRCIINDPVGRVCECDFDAHHREVACRQYTGFATPGVVTTSTSNRPDPATKRRATDPSFYETQCRYTADHRIKIRTLADGTQERFTYGRELRRDCPVRERGNAHIITLRSAGGAERSVTCDYLTGFGSCECQPGWSGPDCSSQRGYPSAKKSRSNISNNFATGGGIGGGGGTPQGDFSSNPIPGVGIVVKRNGAGSSSALVAGNPIGGLTIKGGRNPQPKGSKRRIGGGGSVWDGGDGDGGCTDFSVAGNPIGGISVKGGRNKLTALMAEGGSVWAGEDGEGGCTESARGTNPDGSDCTNHGRPRLHHMTRLLTSHGQVFTWTYDSHGNCTASRTPVAGSGCDMTFNSLGQCTGVTVLNGAGPSLVETYTYDAVTGFVVNAHNSPFDLNLTTTFEHDPLGRITRVADPRGNDWLTEYDVCDRVTTSRSAPPINGMPNRISMNRYYNAGGQLVRMDLEHRDAAGALVAANPAYTAWIVYDNRRHVSRIAVEQRPVDAGAVVTPVNDPPVLKEADYAVIDFTYNDAGECVQCTVPAASRGQSTDRVCLSYYDERGLEWKCQDGLAGAPGSILVQYDYTPAGLLSRRMLLPTLPPPPPFAPDPETTWTYDGFHRIASVTDPMGNVTQYAYDEQGFVTISVMGEVNDVPGSAGNVLLARGRLPRYMVKSDGIVYDVLSLGGGGGGAAAKFPYRPLKADIVVLKEMESPEPVLQRFRPAFFDVFVSDDVWTWERFAPGAPAPHETETVALHRSPAGLVQSATLNGDSLFSCTYDSAWRLQTIQDMRVLVTRFCDQNSNVIRCTRTELSNVAGTPAKTFTYTYTYDALNRLTSSSDGGGNNLNWNFDSCSRVTQCTDPRGVVHRFRYDGEIDSGAGMPPAPFSCLHECDVDNDGSFETLRYHEWRWLHPVRVTNSNGYSATFVRDSADNLVECSYPDGTHESYGFDNYGRCNSITHKDGTVIVADFDRDGRLDLLAYSGGTPGTIPVMPTDYRYNGLGFLTQCDQGDSHLVFTWDSLGNQLSESHNGFTVTRTFTYRGRSSITYPDSTRFVEVRDQFGNIQSVSAVNSEGVPLTPPVAEVGYLGHRVSHETRANGVLTTYEYRGDGDAPLPGGVEDFSFDECVRTVCTRGDGAVIYATRVRRDRSQAVTQSDTFFTGTNQTTGRRHLQTWDRLGRLTHSEILRREVVGGPFIPESTVTYTLDLEGRRLTATGGSNPGAYAQNSAIPPGDHQMSQYSSWPGGELEWDDQGCLAGMGSSTGSKLFIYDAGSRLVAVNDLATGMVSATYAYDAIGRRTRSSVGGDPVQPPVTTFFVYDGSECVQELGGDGLPNITIAGSEIAGIGLCIISRNGTLVYPHGGGGGSSAARGVAIPKFLDYMKKGKRSEAELTLGTVFANPAGIVTERTDRDDAGMPVFLTSDGVVRPGATGTISGYDWFTSANKVRGMCANARSDTYLSCDRYCPETGFFQCHGGVYSPQLGTGVSEHKEKPKPKPSKPSNTGWDLATNKKV